MTEYFVDGSWRKLMIEKEIIKVKGSEDLIFPVRFTHRGPLLSPEIIYGVAGELFLVRPPETKNKHELYSHMWGGGLPTDHNDFIDIILDIADGVGVKDLINNLREKGDQGYNA